MQFIDDNTSQTTVKQTKRSATVISWFICSLFIMHFLYFLFLLVMFVFFSFTVFYVIVFARLS